MHLLHGDDAVLNAFYRKMAQPFAENPQLGAAFCRSVTMDEDGNWLYIMPLQQPQSGLLPDLVERLAVEQRLLTPAAVVRREVYETLGVSAGGCRGRRTGKCGHASRDAIKMYRNLFRMIRGHIRMVDRSDRRALAEQYYKWLTHILENAF